MRKKTAKKKAKSQTKNHIVKRRGKSEEYDEMKVYASVYAAALNAHYGETRAETLAKDVMSKVTKWVENEDTVFSIEIRYQILKHLTDEHVALMYTHHLDIC